MHQPPSGRVALRDFGKTPMSDGEGHGSGDHYPRASRLPPQRASARAAVASNLLKGAAARRRAGVSSERLVWGKAGPCPSCGVVTEHTWYTQAVGEFYDRVANNMSAEKIADRYGKFRASKCVSPDCEKLALWLERTIPIREEGEPRTETVTWMVYPQAGVRIPPADGLTGDELKLYREAAAVAPMSPRAGCALVRVLLEAYLKRQLAAREHPVENKRLVDLIDLAVEHLDLSPTLRTGLTAIREMGNTAMHDPYGLTADVQDEDLPWLFQAVDELVEELHVKPRKWEAMTKSGSDGQPS